MIAPAVVARIEVANGWLRRAEGEYLADLASHVASHRHVVEVGTYCGRSTGWLLAGTHAGRGAQVSAIDAWADPYPSTDPSVAAVIEWTARLNIATVWQTLECATPEPRIIRSTSRDAAAAWTHGTIGLLFLDADKHPARDVEAWLPHLAPDAVVAAHDYDNPGCPDVKIEMDALVASGWRNLGQACGLKVVGR